MQYKIFAVTLSAGFCLIAVHRGLLNFFRLSKKQEFEAG